MISALLWVLAGLVVASLVWLVIQFKTFERGMHTDRTFRVDGEPVRVKMHFARDLGPGKAPVPPKILRWLKTVGFAMLGHCWYWLTYGMAGREVVGHELGHRAQQHILGGPHYVVMAFAQWATQWVHNRRGMEEEVRRMAKELAQSGRAYLTVAGKPRLIEVDWLLPEFPHP